MHTKTLDLERMRLCFVYVSGILRVCAYVKGMSHLLTDMCFFCLSHKLNDLILLHAAWKYWCVIIKALICEYLYVIILHRGCQERNHTCGPVFEDNQAHSLGSAQGTHAMYVCVCACIHNQWYMPRDESHTYKRTQKYICWICVYTCVYTHLRYMPRDESHKYTHTYTNTSAGCMFPCWP